MVLVALALVACDDGRAATEPPPEARFTIDTGRLDEPYRNGELGISFRPPVGWQPLEPGQRDLVAAALLDVQADGRYRLQLVDLFLRTETLSFAAISRVTRDGAPVADLRAYVDEYEQLLVPPEEDQLRARTHFTVNGIDVTQIRHMQGGRISFTLVFTAPDGNVVQLNYSIPPAAYEDEGVKLESSVGTIMHLQVS